MIVEIIHFDSRTHYIFGSESNSRTLSSSDRGIAWFIINWWGWFIFECLIVSITEAIIAHGRGLFSKL